MNDTAITVLTIFLAILIVSALVLLVLGIFLLALLFKARRSVRTFGKAFSLTPNLAYLESLKLKPQENRISTTQIDPRDAVRKRKEIEARDLANIDKATEFRSDF